MSYSFIQPRDPSIDVYNRPRPQQTRLLEPLLLEEEEENSSDSASCSRDATGSSENIAIGEGKAEVYLRLRTLRTGESVQRLFETTLTGLKVLGQKTDTCGRSKAPCTQLYTFTKVFEPLSDQKDIYHSAMRKHIDNEEHAVFLTYGTSGSGKTYTLLGDKVNPGIVPRAVEQIFTKYSSKIASHPTVKFNNGLFELLDDDKAVQEEIIRRKILNAPHSKNGVYEYEDMRQIINNEHSFTTEEDIGDAYVYIWVSFMEIYNEKVYDLLDTAVLEGGQKRPELKVFSNKGYPYAKNLTHLYAKSSEDVIKILNYGLNSVKYESTTINASSSRSHSLFNIFVIKYMNKNYSCVSYRFGDLAGSERLKKTENVGNRLREAQNINKSLMFLGKCLSVLHENQQKKQNNIVPFRESKLTLLIQTALLGKENLVLIVNLYPIEEYYEENLRVLEFASIAREIVHIRSPMKKVKESRFSFLMAQAGSPGMHETLLDENYRLKMELQASVEENCLLREEVDRLQSVVKNISERELLIRQDLVKDSQHRLLKQKELHNQMLENKIEGLKRIHKAEIRKLRLQISMQNNQEDESDETSEDENH